MKRVLSPCQKIEQSIHKKYRKDIWSPFTTAVKRYALIQKDDHIAVCISGGKDSMLLAKCMQLLQRISDVPFELTYLVMDPGYNPENRQKIIDNAKLLEIPVTVFESDIFDVANNTDRNPCYLCARMRRGNLYAKAKEFGCNKIALGHHFSDVIETTLMGMLYGAQIQGMRPRLKSTNFEGMELIRPLYCVHEDAIISWRNYNHLEFLQCACRFTEAYEQTNNEDGMSKRQETKELIRELKKTNPLVEMNIFNSIHDVNVDTLVGYKAKGEEHPFLEEF
ncbi:MAG: tRNA 2-thiocytidine biosynthesis protein TtcA [Lachnospiraceae bacterium]|nr:tRNA 2-thiocytidine biosynthesis protein TtcA [Lachnospiraceae bacterium]